MLISDETDFKSKAYIYKTYGTHSHNQVMVSGKNTNKKNPTSVDKVVMYKPFVCELAFCSSFKLTIAFIRVIQGGTITTINATSHL
jgi:hypothetical protein